MKKEHMNFSLNYYMSLKRLKVSMKNSENNTLKVKIIILIILLMFINIYSPELEPYIQDSANKHDGISDGISLLYYFLTAILLVFCIIDYRRYKSILQLLLYLATIASLVFWADKFSSIDCINCSRA